MYIMLQYKSKEKYILHESEKKDMSITEFEKLEKVLEENCGKYDTDCNKCPLKIAFIWTPYVPIMQKYNICT